MKHSDQRRPERGVEIENRVRGTPREKTEKLLSDRELKRIRSWLKQVRFKRTFFGVSEADVWKKIAELNGLYETMLNAERARYDALLEERIRAMAQKQAGAPTSTDEVKFGELGDDG